MKDVSELSIDEQLSRGATRRTVVTTGAKLAYAAPLVAATSGSLRGGALAACGGATPYSLTGAGGEELCCGCCSQAGLGPVQRAERRVVGAAGGCRFHRLPDTYWPTMVSRCPLAGQPGTDVTRVCIAEDANPPISPPR